MTGRAGTAPGPLGRVPRGSNGGARLARLLACTTAVALLSAASGAGPSTRPDDRLCDACFDVCAAPLNYEDALLDEATDSYGPAAPRAAATAAAIEMAVALEAAHRAGARGHFGSAYEDHAEAIETLAARRPESNLATSAEIRSLKRLRAALYADTVVGLQALAEASPSPEFMAGYRAHEGVLKGILSSLDSPQRMRSAERHAVCQVVGLLPRARP